MRCDYGHDTENQVRVLPVNGGNMLICHEHYLEEIASRPGLLDWEDLEVYEKTLSWLPKTTSGGEDQS
jgi:hypothetical protein